ncbi:MAG: tetratricopeptide repeat protein, partial [Cyanobacteria bacterium J06629_2]
LQTLQTSVAKLDQLAQKLEQEQNETRKLAKELKAIEKFTQMIDKNGEAAQPYYLRGSAYQRSGNIERAIEDLTKAIELRKDHGKAYHKRGLLYVEVDEPQKAIIDLRRASQYYIGKGDLDKYRETRDLSLKLHFNQSAAAETIPSDSQPKSEAVAVGNLFG